MAIQTKLDPAAFIRNPEEWPCWPYLPVKNYDRNVCKAHGELDVLCGILVDAPEEGAKITVYLSNLFALPEHFRSGKKLIDVKKITYPTIQSFFAAGWMVD